jgi:uncharacterized membrane protein YqjE
MRSVGTQQRQDEQPSVVTAVERVFEASQRVVLDRLDLVFVEFQEVVRRTVQRAAMATLGLALVFCGWVALCFVLVLGLDRYMPDAACIAIVGAVNLGAGVVVLTRFSRLPVVISAAENRLRRVPAEPNGIGSDRRTASRLSGG